MNKQLNSLLGEKNIQRSENSSNPNRWVFPAVVINTKDPLNQRRLVARIVSINNEGKIYAGKDKDLKDENIPFAVSLMPNFFNILPKEGEMVYVFLENKDDLSSPRYWIGPIVTNIQNLGFQKYEDAIKIFEKSFYNQEKNIKRNPNSPDNAPDGSDVSIQGRSDAWVFFKPKQVIITAGLFKDGSTDENLESPGYISFSQKNVKNKKYTEFYSFAGVNVLKSFFGKNRTNELSKYEKEIDVIKNNTDYMSLHPMIYGDETIKLLNLIIIYLLNHIHTPQNKPLENEISKILQEYTVENKLQDLISYYNRIN